MNRIFHSMAALVAIGLATGRVMAEAPPLPEVDGKWVLGIDVFGIPPQPTVTDVTPRTIQLLSDAASRGATPEDRAAKIRDLGECRQASAQPAIDKAASDADPMVRAAAAESAGKIGDPSAVRALAGDPDPSVRREAVLAAGELKETRVVTAALDDRDETVIAAAITSASTPADSDKIAGLISRLPARLQPSAEHAIGRLGSSSQAAVLEPFLNQGVASKIAAVQALSRLQATGSLAKIRPLLADSNPSVRREALVALGALAGADERQSAAIAALGTSTAQNPAGRGDPDPSVRTAAAKILQSYPADQDVPALFSWLNDDYGPLHDAARDALVATGNAAEAQAVRLLSSTDYRRQIDGSYILGKLGSAAGMDQHLKLLEFDAGHPELVNEDLVDQACTSLGDIGAAAAPATENLKKVLGLGNGSLAAPAIYALARVGYKPVLSHVPQLLPEPSPLGAGPPLDMRIAGIWAVGILADPEHNANDKLLCNDLIAEFKLSSTNGHDSAVIFESIKAMGNLKYRPALPALKEYVDNSTGQADYKAQWMAHAAYERITDTTIPMPAPTLVKTKPDLSIEDLTGQ